MGVFTGISYALAAIDIRLTEAQLKTLEIATALPLLNPYFIFNLPTSRLFGGQEVRYWSGFNNAA